MTNKNLTFIASGGRTGTQFFGDTLRDLVSDCYSEHEPDMVAGLSLKTLARMRRFGAWSMTGGRLSGQTGVRVIGQAVLENRICVKEAADRLRALRKSFHASRPEGLIVESYYAWWMLAGHMEEIWPGARVVGVLRDPRDWIVSWQRHTPSRRNGAWSERLPPGPPLPSRVGDSEAEALWSALGQIGRLAWEWALIARTLDEAAETKATVRVFRFEDLFQRERPAMRPLVEFACRHPGAAPHRIGDIEAAAGTARNASTGDAASWGDWSDADVAAVAHFCGAGMARHGYGQDDLWREKVESAGSLVSKS